MRNVETVLREALEKLRTAAPKRHKELRDECTAGLEKLDGAVAGGVNADDFFKALGLACASAGSPKVVSIGLDSIQKLMSYSFLTGKGSDPFKEREPGGPPRFLIDSIVESVCNCAEQSDDTVQLQMIRVLLTSVTSSSIEVHGNSLMLAVKTCFTIHRDSKNSMNQRTAQASLTQMLNVVTQRMELSSADMSRRAVAGSPEQAAVEAKGKQAKMASPDLAMLPPATLLNDWMGSYLTQLVDKVVLEHSPGDTRPVLSVGADGRQVPAGKFGWCIVCRNSAAHYCVDTRDSVCSHNCKFRNLQRIQLVETYYGPHREEEEASGAGPASSPTASPSVTPATPTTTPAPEAEAESDTTNGKEVALTSESAPATTTTTTTTPTAASDDVQSESFDSLGDKALNPYHRDALMVFSSLCKISMKDLPPGQTDSRMVRSKRLALELILSMLQSCGPVFKSSEPFIAVLKKLLCISLIKNSVSSIPKIFNLSLGIFVKLITNFKEHLRNEIGVFIEQIFLRILESGNSTYNHKYTIVQVFYRLCTDASTALELFLNFDCDVDERNIFERMIECLTKIAQGKYTSSEHANFIQPHQEQELKMWALQSVVMLMGSIVDWARRMTEDQRTSLGEDCNGQEDKGKDDSDADDDARSEAPSIAAKSDNTFVTNSTGCTEQSSILAQKQRKHDLQIGVNKFNMKPKRGIEYLKQNGFIADDPAAIAEFFRNKEIGLDKTSIGDYLGEDKPVNKAVLEALVKGQDFRGAELDVALRSFLAIFRLPGEAQKIDRMMENFANKYCEDNPDKFANADCAFVLCFALIMLQTDLHNPGIKNKMTKDDFVRNNRGINDGAHLPREYLESLYDSMVHNPISLQEDEEQRTRIESQAAQGASQKFELFCRETEKIVNKSQELMKEKVSQSKASAYVAAQNVEHVRPLFEVAGWPMLATLAVLLETQDTPNSIELCIEGFKHCIRIAARFDMDTERDAFVSSLAKFTYLTTIKEMKQKNIECIKALLAIGLSEGANLGPSWLYVLTCISQLERLQLIGLKARQDFQFFQGEEEPPPTPTNVRHTTSSGAVISTSGGQVLKRRAHGLGVSALVPFGIDDRQVELVNSESVTQAIDSTQIDLLFNRSTSLPAGAIVHFVTQLAKVSKEELALVDQPRIFALQKLVEVADYNMNRIRLVWSRIWRVLSNHFIEVASHQNIKVCWFAIDHLRQLAMKFLEKDELSNFNFQADFLRPFETIMSAPGVSKDVKELIVEIIHNIVFSRMNNIKSGWKTVFQILLVAAQDQSNEAVTRTAFKVLDMVVDKHYHLFVENFSDGIRTLLAFGQCKVGPEDDLSPEEKARARQANLNISNQAITYLLKSANYLADKSTPDPPPPPSSSLVDTGAVTNSSHPAAHWFPILRGLSMLVSDPRRDIRNAALSGLFDILRDHGGDVFDEDTWRMVFNGVIKPLFDDIHHQLHYGDQKKPDGAVAEAAARSAEGTAASTAMGRQTCFAALTALVRLIEAQLEPLSFLLDDVLKMIENCIQQDNEAVARIGVEGFKQLLLLTGTKLSPESWQKVTASILQLFRRSLPTQLMCVELSNSGDGQLPFRKEEVVIQCVVQLLLIDMLQDTVAQHYEHIPPVGIVTVLDALQRSFEFAQEFNQQIELRQTLKRRGFMQEMRQLPGLLKQEREALSCSLKILFQVQSDARMQESQHASQSVERLMSLCSTVLRNYVAKEQLLQEQTEAPAEPTTEGAAREREAAAVETEREVMGLVPIISEVVLQGLKQLQADRFARYAPELFPLLCQLTAVTSREVRVMVRDVLKEQVTDLVNRGVAASPTAAGGAAEAGSTAGGAP